MLRVKKMNKLDYGFSVSFWFKVVTLLCQEHLNILEVCYDSWKQQETLLITSSVKVTRRIFNLMKKQLEVSLFILLPLWTTTKLWWLSDLWGWEFTSLGGPWVAHRVWAIPTCRSVESSKPRVFSSGQQSNKLDFIYNSIKKLTTRKINFFFLNQFKNLRLRISSSSAATLPDFLTMAMSLPSGASTAMPTQKKNKKR